MRTYPNPPKLEIHLCSERRSIFVTFCSEQAAVRYVKARTSYCAIFPVEGHPVPETWTELLDVLYPTCEHGLSLQLCMGPEHYPTDEQERAMCI
jgi:hypothetical protein